MTTDDPDLPAALGALGRPAGAVLVLAGLVHLLVPGTLLWLGRHGYDLVLDVTFDPREGATRRVRLAGLGLVAAGAHLCYHGGVRPGGTGDDG